jgi:RNA polymerase sigma-70 factor, ECF subfamily
MVISMPPGRDRRIAIAIRCNSDKIRRVGDTPYQRGRAAWPDVALDRVRFSAHLRDVPAGSIERFAEDLYLACACSTGDAAAIAAFERELLVPARAAIRAIDAAAQFVDEACQRLRESLLVGDPPRIATYAGHGPLRAWVGVAAARIALMLLRSRKRRREISDEDWPGALSMVAIGNPELDLLKRQHAAVFARALVDAAATLEPRLRSVLRMHFADGLTLDEIGVAYAVHRATAARWIQRARDVIFTESRRLLAERLHLSEAELDRMTSLVNSQLDVSLSQLLPAEHC